MEDFSPAAVARQVPSLAKLLEAREQLANLMRYMDGKVDAGEPVEEAVEAILPSWRRWHERISRKPSAGGDAEK